MYHRDSSKRFYRFEKKVYQFALTWWNYTPWGKKLKVSEYEIDAASLPASFDGFRIVHLSDLHGRFFGRNQEILCRRIAELKPDLILCTGDLVQEFYEKKERKAVQAFLQRIPSIAPVYAILGNHETRSGFLPSILSDYYCSNTVLLRNERADIRRGKDCISIFGIDTGVGSRFASNMDDRMHVEEMMTRTMDQLKKRREPLPYMIVLSHKPENFPALVHQHADLVLSGHAHGGLMRIGNKRLIAPGQGWFPRYTHGMHEKEGTYMVISEGLGGPRIGIGPEIAAITLHSTRPYAEVQPETPAKKN